DGHLVWQGQYGVWGNLQRQARPTGEFNSEQNLRFQGQYFDKETGLHYNTFRYYAPDLGRFTQQDPIGLAGGLNLYQYAPNPLTWVDPWGQCAIKLSRNMVAAGTPRPANSAAHHIVGDTSKGAKPARDILKKHGIDIDDASNGVFLPNKNNIDESLSGIKHNGRHPSNYIDAVNERIIQADLTGGKQGVLDELSNIRNILSSSSRDASWYKIL
ncbi:AHH domain-containing protein, partial [Providencia stuartii]